MPTNKEFNLVDSNKKGGDWFQIHNKHTDAKVGGSPYYHYPKQHGKPELGRLNALMAVI
jgi:hypothetical protein